MYLLSGSITLMLVSMLHIVSGSSYTKETLGTTLSYCPTKLCDMIQYSSAGDGLDHEIQCGKWCETDGSCYFFHYVSVGSECYMCTNNVTGHQGVPQLADVAAYSSANVNSLVYKKDDYFKNTDACVYYPRDCSVYRNAGYVDSGEYELQLEDGTVVQVYCDMDTDAGGWTVFQRRQDGSVNFYQNWAEYENGFGSLSGELWLGNNYLSRIIDQGTYELRVDLEDYDYARRYAVYTSFSIDRSDYYRLSLGSYSGDAGDSLTGHSGQKFSTSDSDNDAWSGSCAISYIGAWWYGACHTSNLNGQYGSTVYGQGMNWIAWRGVEYSMKLTEMKIRPAGYSG